MPFLATKHVEIPTKDILSWCFDAPEYDLDQPVYLDAADPSRHYTGRTARTAIRKLCAGFRAAGLKPGDCVCVHSFNDVDYPVLANGIVGFGGIFAGTNPAYTAHELAHAIRTARVGALVTEPELLPNVLAAAEQTGVPRSRVFVFDRPGNEGKVPAGLKSWRALLECGKEDWERFDDLETAKSTEAARLFSSGTTGLPKATMISHYNFVAQHHIVKEPMPFERRRLTPTPLFHAASAPSMHFSALKDGLISYIMRRFDLEAFLRGIEQLRITHMGVVPPMAVAMLAAPALTKKYSLASIRCGMCGAAPLGKETQRRFKELLPKGVPFTQVWGMTELTCRATGLAYPEDDDTGSVGYALPNTDLKLVDTETGTRDITAYDVVGELCVRNPCVIRGYLGNPNNANGSDWDADGFFHTGDIAYCDGKSRKWFIVDRKKELIKVRGFQVAPPELESVVMAHPGVADAAVIGVKLREEGSTEPVELPRAYVVRCKGEREVTEEDVKAWVKERLASYKRLEGGVVFLDAVPKNPSGKILKRVLREMAEKEGRARL